MRLAITILAVAFLAGLAAFALLAPGHFVLFVGRFHTVLVHFPIRFILLAGLLELFSGKESRERLEPALRLLLGVAAATAIIAAGTGYALSHEGGYSEGWLYWHLRLGALVAVGSCLAFLLKEVAIRFPGSAPSGAYRGALVGTVLLLLPAGHLGGVLAHGSTYLTEYFPEPMRIALRLDGEGRREGLIDLDSALVYQDLVRPVLARECAGCHGEARREGGLRLDTLEGIEEGGSGGRIVVAGQSQGSELVRRMTLPSYDEKRMPPRGHAPVGIGEIELIRWWIDLGASPDLKVAEAGETPFAVQILLNRVAAPRDRDVGIFALEVPAADAGAVQALVRAGYRVTPVAQDLPFLQVQLSRGQTFESAHTALLKSLRRQIVWLDLSGVVLESGTAAVFSELPHLARLNLAGTNVTDADLSHLRDLPYLEYLNLHGTGVGDEGLENVASLPGLRSLFLWRTRATPARVDWLMARNPELTVNLGSMLETTSPHGEEGSDSE
jgi:uncharacterized membrane protein